MLIIKRYYGSLSINFIKVKKEMDIGISYSGAALAGILSFFSPCVLPLVPFYLCYLAGISMEEFRTEGVLATN